MKMALIGIGLIGGSFALAIRATNKFNRIDGFDTDPKVLQRALELKIIDEAADTAAQVVDDASLVVIATPVGVTDAILRAIAPHIANAAIVTDVGSTKTSVVACAACQLGVAFERFVPGHPIAGSERSGVENANPFLFKGKAFISTPVEQTRADAVRYVEELWLAVGAYIERMTPHEHDNIFARISHLPHLLAFALVAHVADDANAPRMFELAGTGFRDFTRIAASSPIIWRDVCLANRDAIAKELTAYRKQIDILQQAIVARDARTIEHIFERAAENALLRGRAPVTLSRVD